MPFLGRLASSPSTGLIAVVCAHLTACSAISGGESSPLPPSPAAISERPSSEIAARPQLGPRPATARGGARDGAEPMEAAVAPGESLPPLADSAEGKRLDISTGTVAFRGLSADQLANIQIIPEMGAALVPAADGTFQGVDGLWLRGERRWFKIPGGTHAVVSLQSADPADAPAAASPSGSQRTVIAGDLVIQTTSSAASTVYQELKGPGAMAGWQVDEGSSAHPTDYPF